MSERVFYGGQALIEGVLMRGAHGYALALRRPSGRIQVRALPRRDSATPRSWSRLPLLRGLAVLWEMLSVGTWALAYSANAQAGPEDEPVAEPTKRMLWGTLTFALLLGLALFFALPLAATTPLERLFDSSLIANLADGVLRLLLVVGYLWVLGRMRDVRRLFAYHGAEHRVINALEAGAPLTPPAVRGFPLSHPRCGTGFLLVVVALAVFVFALLGNPPWPLRLLGRLALLPLIAAVAYELLRVGARNYERGWVRALLAPALALQALTTREPDDEQVAVAIAALERVLPAGEAAPAHTPVGASGG